MFTANDVLTFLDRLEAARSSDVAWQVVQDFFAEQGLPWLCYGYTARSKSSLLRVPELRTNVPKIYVDRWFEDDICANDPCVRHSIASDQIAVFGSEFLRRGECHEAVYEFYRDIRSIGSLSVVTIPLRSLRRKAAGFFEVGGAFTGPDIRRVLEEAQRKIALAIYFADERLLALSDAEASADAGLSVRETECLQWLAKGLRYDQIAYRLGISIATVRFHIANARRKLNVKTPEQAVARAVFTRLIDP